MGWEMTLMKWDSSHVLNHCFSLPCSLQPVLSNLKTRQTGMGRQFPSSLRLKGILLPPPSPSRSSIPRQESYLTHGMLRWSPHEKKNSEFLTSITPSPQLRPPERLPSSFPCNKASSDFNNQIFFSIAKTKNFLPHLVPPFTHLPPSWLVWVCTCLCTHTGAAWMGIGGILTK